MFPPLQNPQAVISGESGESSTPQRLSNGETGVAGSSAFADDDSHN
jgi:hypothetical protein